MLNVNNINPRLQYLSPVQKAARTAIDTAKDIIRTNQTKYSVPDLKFEQKSFFNKFLPKFMRKKTLITLFGNTWNVRQIEVFKGEHRVRLDKFNENQRLTYRETYSPKDGKTIIEDVKNKVKEIWYGQQLYYSKRACGKNKFEIKQYDPKTHSYKVEIETKNK